LIIFDATAREIHAPIKFRTGVRFGYHSQARGYLKNTLLPARGHVFQINTHTDNILH